MSAALSNAAAREARRAAKAAHMAADLRQAALLIRLFGLDGLRQMQADGSITFGAEADPSGSPMARDRSGLGRSCANPCGGDQ